MEGFVTVLILGLDGGLCINPRIAYPRLSTESSFLEMA